MVRWLRRVVFSLRKNLALPTDSRELRAAALLALDKRAFPGAFIYLSCWFAISHLTGVATAAPKASATFTTIFTVLLVYRSLLHVIFSRVVGRSERLARASLVIAILMAGLIFGGAAAASMYIQAFTPALNAMIIVCGVLCTAGTLLLSIDPIIRYGMPIVMLVPLIGALIGKGSNADVTFSLLILVDILYLVIASRLTHADYWNGVRARSELALQSDLFEKQSLTDGLTQINNRLSAQKRLTEEWARALRTRDPLSLLLIDIDHFKVINDKYGHPFGDKCLIEVAGALRNALRRETDFVARFGGEEFLVILPDTPKEESLVVAERVRKSVMGTEVASLEGPVSITCSVGCVTVVPEGDLEGSSIAVSHVDEALYKAKSAGRNRVVVYG